MLISKKIKLCNKKRGGNKLINQIPTTKKSGLSSTIADKHIFIYEKNDALIFVIIDTLVLKNMISSKKYRVGVCYNNPLHISSNGLLVPIEEIEKVSDVFLKIDNNNYYKI